MRFGCCAILALSACYAPQVVGGAPCDPSRDSCPTGQTCEPLGSGNFCTTSGMRGDDAGADAVIVQGTHCYGSGLLGSMCFMNEPAGAVMFAAGVTINTATVGAGNCTEIRAQAGGGPSLCIIAASTINVAGGAPVRVIGSNPLVLVAVQTIGVSGTLDASSHVGDAPGVTAAGARTAMACAAIGIDGATSTSGVNGGGGGGAAGGSFGGLGGVGGNGKSGAAHGNPVLPSPATALVGGCPGGRGGNGNGNCPGLGIPCGGGPGGVGGGAIYLVAGGAITVAGTINASGQGGAGGSNGFNNSGGGGGGGTGGMIGLDAPQIMVTGSIFSNGGGGGGGGGSTPNDPGQPGTDPAAAGVAAAGGTGGQDNGSGTAGGNGGPGSVGATLPGTGKVGTQIDSAGGGGGGGSGVIRVFGVPPASLGGQISPPAS